MHCLYMMTNTVHTGQVCHVFEPMLFVLVDISCILASFIQFQVTYVLIWCFDFWLMCIGHNSPLPLKKSNGASCDNEELWTDKVLVE